MSSSIKICRSTEVNLNANKILFILKYHTLIVCMMSKNKKSMLFHFDISYLVRKIGGQFHQNTSSLFLQECTCFSSKWIIRIRIIAIFLELEINQLSVTLNEIVRLILIQTCSTIYVYLFGSKKQFLS